MKHLSIQWSEKGHLVLLNQTKLPQVIEYVECFTVEDVAEAIQTMVIRGAPAIGAAGAFGMVLAAKQGINLTKAKHILDNARPTAVNLSWATSKLLSCDSLDSMLKAAQTLCEDDIRCNKAIGRYGASLLPLECSVIHHCNTGHLATVGYGTALGVIYSAIEEGKRVHVYVDETRPRMQGARLTAWELMESGVPMHLICDGAAASLMREGKVHAVLFGADRVAMNGDVANKIGTYGLCLAARANNVPTYAAVPLSTIDPEMKDGTGIIIEQRSPEEVSSVCGIPVAPQGVPVYNPAFDVTPNHLISAIITERGICYPPYKESLSKALSNNL